MGYCIIVGCGLSRLWKEVCNLYVNKGECDRHDGRDRLVKKVLKVHFVLLTFLVFTTFGLKTIYRNGDWLNEEKLYRSGVKINPPKALGNLGNVLTQKGRLSEAEYIFRKALEFRPNMADVHYNL
jgi:tetratricopeptide (TPR) repeat protein